MALHQAIMEKEKLEREKQKLKFAFKQKKLEASELHQKLCGRTLVFVDVLISHIVLIFSDTLSTVNGMSRIMYHSTPIHLYNVSPNLDSHLSLKYLNFLSNC